MSRSINNNVGKGVLSGVFAMGVATILVKVLSVLYKIPMLNILGEEGMGYFNTAYTIYSFFYIVCTAGVPKAIMILLSGARERGEHREYESILKSAFRLFFLIGFSLFIIFMLFAGVIAKSIGSPNSVFSMMVIAPSLIIVSVTGVLRGYLSSIGRLGSISVSQILEGIFKLSLGLLLSHYSLELGLSIPMCGAVAILGVDLGALVAMLYMFIVYKKENKDYNIGQKLLLADFRRCSKSIFSISIPITVTSAVMSASSIIDLFMIMSRLSSIGYSEQTCATLYGNYTTLAVPMFNLCISLITPLSIAYLPKLTSHFVRGCEGGFSKTASSFSDLTMLLASFFYAVVCFLPKQSLYFIFGDNGYILGGELLSSLAISVITYSLLIVVNTTLEARGRVRIPLLSMLAGSIIKIPVEYYLLSKPEINLFGAVYSTNVTYIIALIISSVFALKYGAVRASDPLRAGGFFGAAVLAGITTLSIYSRLGMSVENRLHTVIAISLLLVLYLILSTFIILFEYLFGKNWQIAQKNA